MSSNHHSGQERSSNSRPNIRSLFLRASFARAKSLPASVRREIYATARPVVTETTIWRKGYSIVVIKPRSQPALDIGRVHLEVPPSDGDKHETKVESAEGDENNTISLNVVEKYHETGRLDHDVQTELVQAKVAERKRYERACRQSEEARVELRDFVRQCELEKEERAAVREVMQELIRREMTESNIARRRQKVEAWMDGTMTMPVEVEDSWVHPARKMRGRSERAERLAGNGSPNIELRPWDEDVVGVDCDF